MTHAQILLHELAQHGHTTYQALLARYASAGYTAHGFRVAVRRLRLIGAMPPAPTHRRYDIIASHCPCCGRPLEQSHER